MHVFGLTGGIASGKSSVAKLLMEEGVPVIDADLVARDVVAKDTPGLVALVQHFGQDILDKDGSLDRKKLADLVFQNPSLRTQLNSIIHPLIAQESAARISTLGSTHPLVCYDAALLVERGLADSFRPLVVVATSREQQRTRLMNRDGLSFEEAEARINAQVPLEEKIKVADFVIWNDLDLSTLRDRTKEALTFLRTRCSLTLNG